MKKIITLIILITIAAGCASKKKITNRESSEKEKKETVISNELKTKEAIIDSTVQIRSESIITKSNESIKVTPASDTASVIVSKKTEGNVSTWTIKGAGRLEIKSEDQTESKKDTASVKKTVNLSEVDQKQVETETEESEESSSRSSDVDVTRTSTMFSIGAGIGLILLFLILYIRRKRRNPLI